MATTIRMSRGGSKKRPHYSIVVADSRYSRDGRFIEKIGTFDPLLEKDNPARLIIKEDRVKYWIGVGATPSERVESFLIAANLYKRSKSKQALLDKKIKQSQEEVKRKAAEAEAAKKAEEAAKKAEEAAAAAQAAPAAPEENAAS